jgi:hypothetical protein
MYNFVQILKMCVMKNLVVLCVSLVMTLNSFGQTLNVPGTDYPYNSDIITFVRMDTLTYDIIPLNNDSLTIQVELDESYIRENFINSLNKFRSEYGSSPLVLNTTISSSLESSIVYGTPLDGHTWSTYGLFTEYGYVSNFDNKEEKFCDYLIDVMSIGTDLFKELISPNATEFGVYFRQNIDDRTFDFIIYVK